MSEKNRENNPYQSKKMLEICKKEYADTTSKSMIVSSFFQIIYSIIIYLMISLPILITMDVLYIPPFIVFTLNNFYFYRNLSLITLSVSLLQLLFAFIYRKKYEISFIRNIGLIFAFYQLIFIPIGTFFGVSEIKEILDTHSNHNFEKNIENVDSKKTKENISKAIISLSLINIMIFTYIYYLTIYLSAVMLDMTYPFITMSILYNIRLVLISLSVSQILFGIVGYLYSKYYSMRIIKILSYIFGIYNLFIIPIGTYGAILLIKDIRYDINIK